MCVTIVISMRKTHPSAEFGRIPRKLLSTGQRFIQYEYVTAQNGYSSWNRLQICHQRTKYTFFTITFIVRECVEIDCNVIQMSSFIFYYLPLLYSLYNHVISVSRGLSRVIVKNGTVVDQECEYAEVSHVYRNRKGSHFKNTPVFQRYFCKHLSDFLNLF